MLSAPKKALPIEMGRASQTSMNQSGTDYMLSIKTSNLVLSLEKSLAYGTALSIMAPTMAP